MATTPAGVAGVFDRVAETYDSVGVPWFQPIAAGLVDELAVRPGEHVLDIGCGRGAALIPLAHAAGTGGRVLGIDLAPRMVELTARDTADLPQVTVQIGDATAPDLPAGSFDVIASSLVLFFLPDPVAALQQWWPLLKPGGRLGVATFGAGDPRWAEVDAVFLPFLPPAMLDARTSGRTGPFATDHGVAELLAASGGVENRTVLRDIEAVFDTADHLLRFSWSHGQRAMWEAVPAEERQEVARRFVEVASRFADGAGRLAFHQGIRYTFGSRSSTLADTAH